MRLSISTESVSALREFANSMPKVMDNIEGSTENLLYIFKAVSETVGPHEQQLLELLQTVKSAQEKSIDAIRELPYMLNSTADKMASYIGHGSSIGSSILAEQHDISSRYSQAVQSRLNSEETNPYAQRLYNEYSEFIRIVDSDFTGTPFYNSVSKGIKLNIMADLHNPTGNISTYFHEVGHMLDDYAGNGHSWLSDDPLFRDLLEQDAESYIHKVMLEKHCDIEEAYENVSEEISGDWCANVSDIFGSLTHCRCQGEWGHHYTYWDGDPSRVPKEAFANMFESSIGSAEKIDMMKKYFQNAYKRFEYLLKEGAE